MATPAGWLTDPTGRNELRFWDGAQWTDHISNGEVSGRDPFTELDPPAPPKRLRSEDRSEPSTSVTVEAEHPLVASEGQDDFRSLPATTTEKHADEFGGGPPSADAATSGNRRLLVGLLAGLVLVGSVVAVVVAAGGGGEKRQASRAASTPYTLPPSAQAKNDLGSALATYGNSVDNLVASYASGDPTAPLPPAFYQGWNGVATQALADIAAVDLAALSPRQSAATTRMQVALQEVVAITARGASGERLAKTELDGVVFRLRQANDALVLLI